MTPSPTRDAALRIAYEKGSVTSAQLASVVGVSLATASNKLGGYAELGFLIAMHECKAGRLITYTLTPLGERVRNGYDITARAEIDFTLLLRYWGRPYGC